MPSIATPPADNQSSPDITGIAISIVGPASIIPAIAAIAVISGVSIAATKGGARQQGSRQGRPAQNTSQHE
jgi:hypothetical protein